MRPSAFFFASLAFLAACAPREPTRPIARPALRYYVKPAANPSLLEVTLVAENLLSDSLDFTFPVWLPGDFRPIEPGKWVEDVRAYDRATAELPVRRLGPNVWRVRARAAPYFLVRYTLHPVRPDGFKRALISELTREGGYFTGAVAFGYFEGLENYPLSVTFELPGGTPAVCSLESDGPGRWLAPAAFELSQAACAYGPRVREVSTTVRGVTHRLVLSAPADFRPDSLLRVIGEVVESEAALFRALPYPEYTFFVNFADPAGTGFGGAPLFRGSGYYLPEIQSEHVRRSGIPYVLAHQLFHAWNLWAFPPAELSRPPLDRPVATRPLWLVEGLADHYARVLLSRAGVVRRADVYAEIARYVRALATRPEVARANLETAGVGVGRAENREALEPIALKGPIAALGIDVGLRRSSGNAFGADSLLRRLHAAAEPPLPARAGPAPALGTREPMSLARAVPYDSIVGWMLGLGGAPVRSLYASAIAGSGELPTEQILAGAGLELATREIEELNLGAGLVADGAGGFVFRDLVPGGIAARMGVRGGDRLVAVNRQPVSSDNLLPLLAVVADLRSGRREGKPVTIRVERSSLEVELKGNLAPWTRKLSVVQEDAGAPPAAAAVREAIFSGPRREGASTVPARPGASADPPRAGASAVPSASASASGR